MRSLAVERLEPRRLMAAAYPDTYAIALDGILLEEAPGVLGNDTGLEVGDVATIAQTPSNGRLALAPSGAFAYAPDLGFHGIDTWRYEVNGSQGLVTMFVGGPVVVDDAYAVPLDTPLVVAAPGALGNDVGEDLSFEVLATSAGQSLGWHTGWFSWVPPSPTWTGVATIDYRATDAAGLWADGVIAITVAPSGGVTKTYTIRNDGTADLVLGDPPVTVTGLNPTDFLVVREPALVVGPRQSTTFNVRFEPTAPGLRQAAVNVWSNDADENPYDFAVHGTAVGELADFERATDLVFELKSRGDSEELAPDVAATPGLWMFMASRYSR